MKIIFLLVTLLTVQIANARQYIQCADYDSWDRAVINLDGEKSTLFMTNGVHLPDEIRVLKKLNFEGQNDYAAIYATNEGPIIDRVFIPLLVLNRASQSFEVDMEHINTQNNYSQTRQMGCYSAIYND